MVDYGTQSQGQQTASRGLGDPITVAKQGRPTTTSLARWAKDWTGRPEQVRQGREILARLSDEDLRTWGYERADIERELAAIPDVGGAGRSRALSRYTLERRLLILLRRNIHHNALGRLVRAIRRVCDVLLR